MKNIEMQKPSNAFIGASWIVLIVGMASYIIGLWNAEMQFNEKGYYFTVLIFGLFAVISLQKTVRDQLEGIPVTNVYYGLAWGMSLLSELLIVVGLWNAELELSEKGFFGISFILSLFSSIAVQKNLRDVKSSDHDHTNKPYQEP